MHTNIMTALGVPVMQILNIKMNVSYTSSHYISFRPAADLISFLMFLVLFCSCLLILLLHHEHSSAAAEDIKSVLQLKKRYIFQSIKM